MQIYISHSENETQLAQHVSRQLRNAGYDTTGVVSELLPGENWAASLGEALRSADWCVLLMKAGSLVNSDRMRAEVQFMLGDIRFRDRVIPILAQFDTGTNDVPWVLTNLPTFRQVATSDAKEIAEEIIAVMKGAALAN